VATCFISKLKQTYLLLFPALLLSQLATAQRLRALQQAVAVPNSAKAGLPVNQ
jgi:hypothetical protein